jgi:hypothetical protein
VIPALFPTRYKIIHGISQGVRYKPAKSKSFSPKKDGRGRPCNPQ